MQVLPAIFLHNDEYRILLGFEYVMVGGNGKDKGKSEKSGKGAGKGMAPTGISNLAVSDADWEAMSGKQRKFLLRAQNMVLHISGPQKSPGQKPPPRQYKDAAGPGGNPGGWYESRGPWVVCQNPSCPGCKRKGVVTPSFKYVADVQVALAVNSQRCLACNKPWQDSIQEYELANGPLAKHKSGTGHLPKAGIRHEAVAASPFATLPGVLEEDKKLAGSRWQRGSPFVQKAADLPKTITDKVPTIWYSAFVGMVDKT